MKLLDKLAKKLGYIPADSMLVKPMVITTNRPVLTFGSSITVSRFDLNHARAEQFDWHKRKLVEDLNTELISCMDITEGIDMDGNIILRGRLSVLGK